MSDGPRAGRKAWKDIKTKTTAKNRPIVKKIKFTIKTYVVLNNYGLYFRFEFQTNFSD